MSTAAGRSSSSKKKEKNRTRGLHPCWDHWHKYGLDASSSHYSSEVKLLHPGIQTLRVIPLQQCTTRRWSSSFGELSSHLSSYSLWLGCTWSKWPQCLDDTIWHSQSYCQKCPAHPCEQTTPQAVYQRIRKTFLKNPSSPIQVYTSGITPTTPDQRREPEDLCIKKTPTVRTGMCHILMEAPLSLDNALVLCHIHLIHTGQAGLRDGLIFLTLKHKAAERRSPWLTQGEEKRLSNQNNTHSSSCLLDSRYWRGSSCSAIESAHSLWWSNFRV